MKFQKVVILFISIALAGCASVRPLSHSMSHPEISGIYGLLENSSSGYFFREFSDKAEKDQPWVNLENFQPTWRMGKSFCIGYGLLALQDPSGAPCMSREDREKFFYAKKHVDYTTTMGAIAAMVTISTGGLLPILLVPSTDYFDTDRYEQAVNQAWTSSVEKNGGIAFLLSEKSRIQRVTEGQNRIQVAANLDKVRQEQIRREAMGRQILAEGVGTQVCNKDRYSLIRVGYVERIENGKIKITISNAHYENSSLGPGGFRPGVVWDLPENWYKCAYR